MRLTARSRWWLKWQGYITAALLVATAALLGYLSTKYERTFDWTAARRHTLSDASRAVLDKLDKPVAITAFVTQANPLRDRIRYLVERYQRLKHDIALTFVDPDTAPDRVRSAGVRLDGELVVAYEGREQHVNAHSEQAMTNALQSLARGGERWVVFVEGHGERDAEGGANHDLGQFGEQLANRGVKVQPLTLGEAGSIPDNTAVLVIASPQVGWLPAEVKLVEDYLDRGGNLLLLTEPGSQHGLEPVLRRIGVNVQTGTIVDPTTRKLGIDNAGMTLVARYPPHPATQGFRLLSVFPLATALTVTPPQGWESSALLQTADAAWSETGDVRGEVVYDEGKDVRGPLDIAVALTRETGTSGKQQRVVVAGDGDFLSNAFLGNSGNLDLGVRLFTWLSADDALIDIPARTTPDATLELSPTATLVIGFGFLVALPLALFATGAAVWFRRRR